MLIYSQADSVLDSFRFIPEEVGTYILKVTVVDYTGYTVASQKEFKIKKLDNVRSGSSVDFSQRVPANKKTTVWTSSNPNVASIDANGILTAHKIGTTTIRAYTSTGESFYWDINVTYNWWQTLLLCMGVGILFLPFWIAR